MTNEEYYALVKKNPVPVICGLVAFGAAIALYLRSGDFPEAEAELIQKSSQAERYALNIKNSTQLKEQLDELTAANKNMDGRLMRVSQRGINTQYFYKLERETGVKLLSFAQSNVEPPKAAKATYVPVTFTVAVQGTFAQVMNFLRQLEAGTHYVRVMAANCSTNPSTRNNPVTLTLSLEMLGIP